MSSINPSLSASDSDPSRLPSGASGVSSSPVEQDTRTRLLIAAGPVFAESGYQRATIRDISHAANVNVASVAYYFGDKMGLYRAVIEQIRRSREQRFPAPENTPDQSPEDSLSLLISTMLSRMIKGDQHGWESQLIMREMDEPTSVFREMVQEFFRPIYDQLKTVLRSLLPTDADDYVVEQFALSVVGQCVYYRIGRLVINELVPSEMQDQHFGIESLCRHIVATTIASARDPKFGQRKRNVRFDREPKRFADDAP
jgi:AcrR family transcriptional regulator